jgi:hypothetical protein
MINMIAFGAILWVMNVYILTNGTVKKFANAIVVAIAVPFVLGAFLGPIA